MNGKPPYVVHEVPESDVTVDWLFGPGHVGTKITQYALLLVGWFFTVLPVVVTGSALLNRHTEGGWWSYEEGFAIWDQTMVILGIILVIFIVGFLALHLVHRRTIKERNQRVTHDEQRLIQRLEIADVWYAEKFGPEPLRGQQKRVQITPYGDVETHELRGLYRASGVD